ncbi:MAG: hypothetical protein K6G15_09405 [Desulfovibrio sp.]|nr:hypothetical protein [Desulfovibrio sp.]
MSQNIIIENNKVSSLSHYELNGLEKPKISHGVPDELIDAKPLPKSSSGWKLAGRIVLGILTVGTSELLRLAWLGITSMIANGRPRPIQHHKPRVQEGRGLPAAAPDADKTNTAVRKLFVASSKDKPSAEYQQAVDTVLSDLRKEYGEELVPKGLGLNKVFAKIDGMACAHMSAIMGRADHALTPREVYDIIKNYIRPKLNQAAFASQVKRAAEEIGGLGGIDVNALAQKLLEQSGQKNVRKLETLTNRADVDKLFNTLGMPKAIADIKAGMFEGIEDVRKIFGADKLPDSFNEILQLKTDFGSTICKKISEQLSEEEVLNKASIRNLVKENLGPSVRTKNIHDALTKECDAQAMPLRPLLMERLTKDILKMNKKAFEGCTNAEGFAKAMSGARIKELVATQKQAADSLYAQYQSQVRPECCPLLKTFINDFSFAPISEDSSRESVAKLVDSMKNWKNVQGDDDSLDKINQEFKNDFDDDYSKLAGAPGETTGWQDNIYGTLLVDCNRSSYSFNGKAIPKGIHAETVPIITEAIKTVLPNALDQQFVSKIANQRLGGKISMMSNANGFSDTGKDMSNIPGFTVMPFVRNTPLLGQSGLDAEYDVSVAQDKKTALLKATTYYTLDYPGVGGMGQEKPHFGVYKVTYTFNLNLSANEKGQGIDSFKLGQEFFSLEQEQQLLAKEN